MFSLNVMIIIVGILIVGFVVVQKVLGPLPKDLKEFEKKRKR